MKLMPAAPMFLCWALSPQSQQLGSISVSPSTWLALFVPPWWFPENPRHPSCFQWLFHTNGLSCFMLWMFLKGPQTTNKQHLALVCPISLAKQPQTKCQWQWASVCTMASPRDLKAQNKCQSCEDYFVVPWTASDHAGAPPNRLWRDTLKEWTWRTPKPHWSESSSRWTPTQQPLHCSCTQSFQSISLGSVPSIDMPTRIKAQLQQEGTHLVPCSGGRRGCATGPHRTHTT